MGKATGKTKRPKTGSRGSSTIASSQELREMSYVFEMSVKGYSITMIAARSSSDLGYPLGLTNVGRRLKAAQAMVSEATLASVEERRASEAEKLDAAEVRISLDLSEFVILPDGSYALDEDGQPRERDPKIRQNAEVLLLRNRERRAKLLGLDAPAQVEVTHTTVDPADIELRRLIDEAAAQSEAPYPMKENPS